MDSLFEVYPQKSIAKVPINKVYRLRLNNISISNISYTKDETEYIPYTIRIDDDEIAVIKNKILDHSHFKDLDMSEMKLDNIFHGKVHGDIIIKHPVAKNNMLHAEHIKIFDSVSMGDTSYARGIFDLTAVVVTERDHDTIKVISCIIREVHVKDEQIRYMGDCVFPDYFIDIGEQSVPIEVVNEFMKIY